MTVTEAKEAKDRAIAAIQKIIVDFEFDTGATVSFLDISRRNVYKEGDPVTEKIEITLTAKL